jgi:AcrR family transcriptional regulator
MDTRTKIVEVAEELLEASPEADIQTRAVCEKAGVGAPVLYRLFGDKNGLLSAVVDHGFERYLSGKRAAVPSTDPVADLRDGWDSHVAFALAHPSVYRLMYSPSFAEVPAAAGDALELLRQVLTRCAEAGKLRVSPDAAAQAIMAANVGVSVALITQPRSYADPDLSHRVRDAVHARVLVDSKPATDRTPSLAATALRLSALLDSAHSSLTEAEAMLLHEWMGRLAASGSAVDQL